VKQLHFQNISQKKKNRMEKHLACVAGGIVSEGKVLAAEPPSFRSYSLRRYSLRGSAPRTSRKQSRQLRRLKNV